MRASSGDTIDDQLHSVELGELVEFVADFLARAEGPLLRSDFARFTYGSYSLEELRADLRRLAVRLRADT